MPESLVNTVGNGAVVVERGEHVLERGHYVGEAADIEEGFLLSGKGGVGQVFGGGAGTHRHRYAFVPSGQLPEALSNLRFELSRKRRRLDPAADLRSAAPERLYVVGIEPLEPRFDAGSEGAPIEELPESIGRGGETAGDPDSRLGELADHLAQRCVFPSDLLDVSHSEPIEIHHVFEPSHGSGPSPRLKDHLETVMLQAAHPPRSQNTPPGPFSCPTAAEPSSSSPTAPESRSRCSATACLRSSTASNSTKRPSPSSTRSRRPKPAWPGSTRQPFRAMADRSYSPRWSTPRYAKPCATPRRSCWISSRVFSTLWKRNSEPSPPTRSAGPTARGTQRATPTASTRSTSPSPTTMGRHPGTSTRQT